jgi:hypothetical protein
MVAVWATVDASAPAAEHRSVSRLPASLGLIGSDVFLISKRVSAGDGDYEVPDIAIGMGLVGARLFRRASGRML